jgi:REP element-mobilizing transposase RayT
MAETPYFYRNRLPHWQPPGGTFFVTYRLAGSLPKHVVTEMAHEAREEIALYKQYFIWSEAQARQVAISQETFASIDLLLDIPSIGPTWLKQPEVAQIVMDSWLHLNEGDLTLYALCIMSNHVHVLLSLPEESNQPLHKIMQRHKSYTAKMANRQLGRSGPFWQKESYDHLVRHEKSFWKIFQYILDNPVKARLVGDWQEWPWTWVNKPIFTAELE